MINSFGPSFLSLNQAIAQNAEKLNLAEEKLGLEKEIAITQKLLDATRNDEKASLNDLKLIQRQINSRHKVIENTKQQLFLLEGEMASTENAAQQLELEIEKLQNDYAETLRKTYKLQGGYNKLLYLFSAESVNEAYKRMKYLGYYTDHRKSQFEELHSKKEALLATSKRLTSEKEEKVNLLIKEEEENQDLQTAEDEKEVIIKQLKNKASKLQRSISKKRKSVKDLEEKIKLIIERIAAEEEEVNIKTGKEPDAKSVKLSDDFTKNKGKLPWPVNEGVITGKYGTHPHPLLPHISTTNNGIDITTVKGAKVKSIFEGEVTKKLYSPTFQHAILVKHGKYFTVYSNLSEILVEIGDKISLQQDIGIAYTDPEDNRTEVHLEIWSGRKKDNPKKWIKTR